MVDRAADPESFHRLVAILSRGGVAIVPCDTMYGIVGLAPETDGKIRRIKGRGEDKPFLQLIGDSSWVARMSDMAVPAALSRHWPGPLTLVFPARGGGSVALRYPDSPFLQRLLDALGRPLYSTSVNRSGAPPLADIATMVKEFEKDVDLIYDAGRSSSGPPSTLIDITRRPFQVLRPGAIHVSPEELV
ncbi:MAG TPA: L-threonylcarbamoyladenylate synthase [Spirochaetia bacterium]|nr:L-threonylcarbamoyladenylate synthase [Spirochaetia bacterium]